MISIGPGKPPYLPIISTEGALRRPLTYDDNPIHPPPLFALRSLERPKEELGRPPINHDELRRTKTEKQKGRKTRGRKDND